MVKWCIGMELRKFFFINFINKSIKSIVNCILSKKSYIIINIESKDLIKFLIFIKNSSFLQFKVLIDLWAVDYLFENKRFEINYLLLSPINNLRVIIKVRVKNLERISSVTSLYNSADWLEREVWDLFGIFFFGHNDLRRILTDYGFEGYPLRKDFPLSGFLELRYDEEEKRIIFDKVEFVQQFRFFEFKNPWII